MKRTAEVTSREGGGVPGGRMTMLSGGDWFLAMQTHLARAEALYPDWESKLLKFNLRYARLFQLKCEGQPRRHAGLLVSPEYQDAARRTQQLQGEYHLWLSRSAECRRKDSFEQVAQKYLTTQRDQRHATLYVERFQPHHPLLIASLVHPDFQAHHVAFPGLGLPDQWTYIKGKNTTRAELEAEIQVAQARLLS